MKKTILTMLTVLLAVVAQAALAQDDDVPCNAKRHLFLGNQSMELKPKPARCLNVNDDAESATFEIKVHTEGMEFDLSSIVVDAKDAQGPLRFEIVSVNQDKMLLHVLVTWDTLPGEDPIGYNITVPNLGVLDPTVRIITNANLTNAYVESLRQLAELFLDEAEYEVIVRDILPRTYESE